MGALPPGAAQGRTGGSRHEHQRQNDLENVTENSAKQSARIKGNERFEGFMQNLGRRLATGDRFLKELSRDMDSLHDGSAQDQPESDSDRT